MMRRLFFFLCLLSLSPLWAQVLPGATDTAAYLHTLRGARIAVLANHTAMVNDTLHLVDMLHAHGLNLVGIFSPEHGFRGTADAGEQVASSVDARTGIPILSLYDGHTNRPKATVMHSFDLLLVDMQDVGLRFYTYYITMLRMMDACADSAHRVIILDRPNPNGHYLDGPILDMKYKSGVGALPIPVVHGMTLGELARMSIGQGWIRPCSLEVVRCRHYTHATPYQLPVAPSPNLTTEQSVLLYPSLCLFEGTVVSLGRGTTKPFACYGHPDMRGYDFSFTPHPGPGAKQPPLNGRCCYGVDLSTLPDSLLRRQGFTLDYLLDAYHNLNIGERFFTPFFEKLIGVSYLREMILQGCTAAQIRARWQADITRFRTQRRPYLLYQE